VWLLHLTQGAERFFSDEVAYPDFPEYQQARMFIRTDYYIPGFGQQQFFILHLILLVSTSSKLSELALLLSFIPC
jgi:hypothetical protein